MSILSQIAIGWAVVAVTMVLLWLLQRRTGDAGVVDVGWSASIGCLAIFFAATTDAYWLRSLLVMIVASLWSFRLASYLLRDRILKGEEDARYQFLREYWGAKADRNLFWFFQAQALGAVLMAVPILIVMHNPTPYLRMWDVLGAAIVAGSVLGEGVADAQLARFRGRSDNKGKTCRDGLWRYSRHPNYFFEWLHWWGYCVIAIGTPYGWLALLGPAVMFLFLFRLTGIPYTERQALSRRGDDYRRYQRTTSVFIPWFPREEPT
ncbi:3-oxo-5-alpha-steroid 4-dehydrogenase [Planctomycetes bacterium Pan216]|uniref:3-oxo-5-alpha-steroid 4-dehydrogenase n=1 Tax=Kolteria novifilia TaxID=2527975 RepID=A0A518B196_9BACT|nr:3-oxo-5-alpha-steroid 4-dehydrogenase [Planctomycetes bacterium Pan216]